MHTYYISKDKHGCTDGLYCIDILDNWHQYDWQKDQWGKLGTKFVPKNLKEIGAKHAVLLMALPAPEPDQLNLGWNVKEIIGMAIVNPRGLEKGNG